MDNIRLLEEFTDIEGLKQRTMFDFYISKFCIGIKIIPIINEYYHGKSSIRFFKIDKFIEERLHLFSELNHYDKLIELIYKQL